MLRKIFPRTLLFRSLLIIVVPIILIQVVIGAVFLIVFGIKPTEA